jgi:predicted nicotinamide N-methyase
LAATDSTPAAPDVIADFGNGSDVIDFTAIAGITFDAVFSATTPTTVAAHSIVYFQSGADTHIVANASAGSENVTSADMLLVLTGVNAATLNATAIHQ